MKEKHAGSGQKRTKRRSRDWKCASWTTLYIFRTDRDPRMRIISVAYMATVPKYKIKNHFSGDDANSSEIFDIFLDDDGKLQLVGDSDALLITGNELAFDHEKL